jgi:hypothetical protein
MLTAGGVATTPWAGWSSHDSNSIYLREQGPCQACGRRGGANRVIVLLRVLPK